MITELNKLCRTCMAPDKDVISIYDEESNDHSFRCSADIIGILTNIMPNKSDGLSELVCLPCSNEIKKIHSFKMKCINSESILRKILEQANKEKKILPSDAVDKYPDQTLMYGEENNQQISSCPPGFLIIKSEEPSCSFYGGQTDNEEKQTNLMVPQGDHESIETHQILPMEAIVKEEPSLCAWSGQNYESEIKPELREASTNGNEESQTSLEPNLYEQNSQKLGSDVQPELTEANINEIESLEILQQSDKEGKSKLKCPNCHKLFMHLARLKRHIRNNTCVSHTPGKEKLGFTCSICGKQYNHQFSLQRHSLISHKKKLTKEIITESLELSKELKKTKIKDIVNEVQTEVTQPINNEVDSIEAMRQCNRCKEVFESDEALALHKTLARHKKPHSTEKEHICTICYKAFSFSHNLKIHLMNHKEIKPFKCEQCNHRFVRNSCLTRHLKTHTGDRPFTCEFCSKGFPYKYALKIHERSHMEERPYSCTICSMRFKSPNTLKEHHRTHTGEKPYACKLCPRRLSSKTNFRIHMRSHEKKHGMPVQELITDSEKK